MENTETTNVVSLDNLNANNLPELQGWKDKQLKLVEENPYIEIEDNKTYEVAKQRRTALLKGRTSLEAQDKLIASKLSSFRKDVKTATDELISITLPHEERQQEEVKRFEQIKENERLERERLENERIANIENKISEFETSAYEVIQSITLDSSETDNHYINDILTTDFDFEEFDILWQHAKKRIEKSLESKLTDLSEKENQRLENQRLAREKAEADAKLEAIQKQQEKERAEREAKEREEKEKVFEVRKNRLAEIGFIFNDNLQKFFFDNENITISKLKSTIFDADVIDFENMLADAKTSIQNAKESAEKLAKEKEKKDAEELALKKKAEKENKERVKRLAKDKAIYKKALNNTLGNFPVFHADELEVREFSELASKRVEELKNQLLTELENL